MKVELRRIALVAGVAALGMLLLAGCESDLAPVQLPDQVQTQNLYVGAARCGTCHQDVYTEFMQSGHPYKLNKVVDGQPPVYPYRDQVPFPVVSPPDGVDWSDVSYVIGGYGWKARFIDQNGYIITGDAVQWNMETGEWVAYHGDEPPGTVPYNCGRCHTTGYQPEGNQDGLEGMVGTWAEDGITCEACHGPGGLHAASRNPEDITVDRAADVCGRCHYRDSEHRIAAGGPDSEGAQFIKHHEQYDEMLSAGHRNLTCVSCHDPHKSTRFDQPGALVLDCESCHQDVEVANTGRGQHTCEACHMPHASKSAVKRGPFEGDIPTHIFRINTDADAQMFYQQDGQWFANGFVTTDFACLSCHTDRDRAWAEQAAETIHPHAQTGQYAASSEQCRACHEEIYTEYVSSGHPYKLNKVVDGQPPTYPHSDMLNFPMTSPPAGYTWDDVSYVIGGYGWKARFIDQDGYIVTGSAVQWNMETGEWVAYHGDEPPGTVPYNCGRCHTTGYSPEGNQDGKPGLIGTWVETGITCQACHGPGATHVRTHNPSDITIDRTAELCGRCHYRDSEHRIAAGGPDSEGAQFIKHHEQFDELINGGHPDLSCIDCHDPHKSTRFDDPGSIVNACTDCHGNVQVYVTGDGEHTCEACHMPHLAKSAVKRGPLEGDIPSHLFRISLDTDFQQFYQEDGGWFANGYISLDFACLRCHTDQDRAWAAGAAAAIHGAKLKLAAKE